MAYAYQFDVHHIFPLQLFLSDRLKRAIKEAGIKARRMTMRKCVVVA
jgi:hypothetical protein